MEFPITIESQDDFDRHIKDRLDRQKKTIDDLTARAETAESTLADTEQARAALEQERDAAVTRATTAETRVGEFETRENIAKLRAEVAQASGVPAAALRGNTKEELEAHAAELKPLLTAQEAPVIPNQGIQPEKPAAGEGEERAAVRTLFGTGDGD